MVQRLILDLGAVEELVDQAAAEGRVAQVVTQQVVLEEVMAAGRIERPVPLGAKQMTETIFITAQYLLGVLWTAAIAWAYCRILYKLTDDGPKLLAAVLFIGIGFFPGFLMAGTAVRDIDTAPYVRGALIICWAVPIGVIAYYKMPRP